MIDDTLIKKTVDVSKMKGYHFDINLNDSNYEDDLGYLNELLEHKFISKEWYDMKLQKLNLKYHKN